MDESSTSALDEKVRRAQRGDEGALRDLIVGYQHRIAGFTYAITGRSDSVEDIVQMVFIKMARAISRLKAPEQFESWLFRLARNTCIDHLRRQKLRRIFTPFAPEHENVPETDASVDPRSSTPSGMPSPSSGPRTAPSSPSSRRGAATPRSQRLSTQASPP
jgi:RNA polymerase sigma-70 factor (ECF subfamily)